ncbi:MAG TPA: ABC transporter permease [Candidatus Binatia bacterium]|jgi:NitT/TauT family transport system permease protein|nr:ABC transporter permease [Candidatus Binatia bacterium]
MLSRILCREITIPLTTSLVMLAAWEALVHTGMLRAAFFPAPTDIARTLSSLALSGELWLHVTTTLGRLIASFLIAVIPGTAIGLAMGWWIEMRMAADPLVRLLFPIPSIAFFPLVIFYLGLSEWGLLLTAAITPFLVIVVQAQAAVAALEQTLLEAGRNYGATGLRLFLRVILPAALPHLFIGYRLALGVGFIVTVAVEMVAAKHGLGGFLWHSWQILRIEEMYVGLVLIGFLGILVTYGLEALADRLMPWQVDLLRAKGQR